MCLFRARLLLSKARVRTPQYNTRSANSPCYLRPVSLDPISCWHTLHAKAFANDPPTTVFLLSVRSGAVGINLTQANNVFLLEPVSLSRFGFVEMEAATIGGRHYPDTVKHGMTRQPDEQLKNSSAPTAVGRSGAKCWCHKVAGAASNRPRRPTTRGEQRRQSLSNTTSKQAVPQKEGTGLHLFLFF